VSLLRGGDIKLPTYFIRVDGSDGRREKITSIPETSHDLIMLVIETSLPNKFLDFTTAHSCLATCIIKSLEGHSSIP
jgi:hypothetical protein